MRSLFAKEITNLAKSNKDIVLLSGDIGNRMFDDFKNTAPDRYINCGIAEANMMSLAAGMSLCGLRPFVYTITPFTTTRCLEQIKIGVAYHNSNVVIIGTGSGLSYAELGPTHHSLEDIAIIRSIPNIDFDTFKTSTLDSIRALRLIRAFRMNGHLIADLDPLKILKRDYPSELDYKSYGFSESDLEREIFIDGSLGLDKEKLKKIIKILKETYCSSIGVEFLHIQQADQKQWVQERIEEVRNKTSFTSEGKKAIYKRIVESELFEQFLDKKFLGTKRYGIEGGESMIPGIEQIVKQACLSGIEDIIIGTAHRGRLTLLSSVLEMSVRRLGVDSLCLPFEKNQHVLVAAY